MKWHVRFGWVALAPAIFALASGCQPAAVEKGWRALRAGKLGKAEAVVDRGLKKHRDSLALWDLKFRICLLKRSWRNCPKVFRQVRRHDSNAVRWGLDLMVRQSLWAGLKCKKAVVRRRSARLARDLRVTGLTKVLREALSDRDARASALAAGALWTRDEEAREVMRKLSRHPDHLVRQELAAGLGRRPHHRFAAELLLKKFAADAHPGVRVQALSALGKVRPRAAPVFRQAVRALLHASRDPSGWVRAEAVHQLVRLRRPGLWPQVKQSLSDPHLGARLAGLRLLKRSRLRREKCRVLVGSKDIFLALRAAVILARRRAPGFRPGDLDLARAVLKRAGEDPRWDVRAAACNAASSMKGFRSARQAVYWGLVDRHPRVRMAAARTALTLGESRDKAISVLKALITERPELATSAAHILALRRIPFGIGALKRLATSGRTGQKRSAVVLLGALRKELDAVLNGWASGPWSVRLAADQALWKWWRR